MPQRNIIGDIPHAAHAPKCASRLFILTMLVFVFPASWGRADEWLQSEPMPRSAQPMYLSRRAPSSAETLIRLPPVEAEVRLVSDAEPISEDHNGRLGFGETDELSQQDPSFSAPAAFLQPMYQSVDVVAQSFAADPFLSESRRLGIGFDFYSAPEFEGGLIVHGENVAMKIGGYVKADFIYDFDPIDATDSFVTTTIPIGAPHRTNSRFHARQTRLSFDTRWKSNDRTIRIYIEGDFFSEGDQFRLRQAYGEVGSLLVGRTWTTFTDVAAAPATLDFEGSVSAVNRRQALARWTQPIVCDDLTMAVAVEDTRFIIASPVGITGEARSPSPDFVANLRLDKEWGQFQAASLHRIGGFQPTGAGVVTGYAWGLNFTGAFLVTPRTKAYYQIVFGDGIGSYRGLPDAAPNSANSAAIVGLFGWMTGVTHDWTDQLSSNFTYAANSLDNAPAQSPDDVHQTTYLAANLIWSPLERTKLGIEYLYGTRENISGANGQAHRLQMAFIFDLP